MTIGELMSALEQISPLDYAEPWDNVGLILGDGAGALTGPTLLTIDFTQDILDEAIDMGSSLVIAYHPPIWDAVKRVTSMDPKGKALLGAMRAGISIYSPHTALDAAPGGVTDWLCDMLAEPTDDHRTLGDRRALEPTLQRDPMGTHKIVTFVPAMEVEKVRNALASVGAGIIGDYSQCSFSSQGTGTFFGAEGTNPAVGRPGELQHIDEIRLEMVCPSRSLSLAVEMLRQFHPYDEPPIDLYELTPKPRREVGAGRRITLDRPTAPSELAKRLKHNLGVDAVKLAAASDEPIHRIGVCPGAGAGLLESAIEMECQLFVTGEMSHHESLVALSRGCSVLLAGHTNTERGFLPAYADKINAHAPGAGAIHCSRDHTFFRTLSE